MTAIISITEQGNQLALKLSKFLNQATCYTLPKYASDDLKPINGKLKDFCAELFSTYNNLVFVMATGIVVRSIAPHLRSKTTDPAVIVLDEKGNNVISLLSGHLGGANALTQQIAAHLNSNPVITTASDVNQLPSVDMLAQEHGLIIDSMVDAKDITALIVNRKNVVISDPFHILPPLSLSADKKDIEGKIIVSNRDKQNEDIPFVKLIPKNVILGMGCKKDTPTEQCLLFIKATLNKYNIDKRSIALIASIDVKENEQALIESAAHYKCPFKCYGADVLQTVESLFEGSDFVKQTVGVTSVSAPAAYIAGNKQGRFICEKERQNGITISIFEVKKG
ncbi:cobalt-precorrin 5A hydrolase [Saccharicrinis aurantiacus]|uniref:cobalt-precorrin 5A hydrolase n=1 Tax=Saccharicrinis aurantiacus TaxID=1849719 RepID=UPI0008397D85|nr:cobalt-precorrin 5A hydrolase [Saccharicrinis aurantiacus]